PAHCRTDFPASALLRHVCRHCTLLALGHLNATPSAEIYTLSLHDALPIYVVPIQAVVFGNDKRIEIATMATRVEDLHGARPATGDRKSTRLNSSHVKISYAVFCLKKKRGQNTRRIPPAPARPPLCGDPMRA